MAVIRAARLLNEATPPGRTGPQPIQGLSIGYRFIGFAAFGVSACLAASAGVIGVTTICPVSSEKSPDCATFPSLFHQVHLPVGLPAANSPRMERWPFSCHHDHSPCCLPS